MTLNDFTDQLISAAISAGFLGAIGLLVRSWFVEKIKKSVSHEYDQKLAKLNDDLQRERDARNSSFKASFDLAQEKLRASSAAFGEMQKATIGRKIEAVDELWQTTVRGFVSLPTVLGLIDRNDLSALTPDQLKTLGQMADRVSSDDATSLVPTLFGDVRRHRPFLGEPIWTLFSVYQSIVCRVLYLTFLDPECPNRFTWHKDGEFNYLVALAFGEEAVEDMKRLQNNRLEWLRGRFEREVMTSVNKLLKGEEFGAEALAHANHISNEIFKLPTFSGQSFGVSDAEHRGR